MRIREIFKTNRETWRSARKPGDSRVNRETWQAGSSDIVMLFFVKDGRKFRYIAVLEIRPWIKRQRLNERTACLNGKFLKDFHFSVLLYSLIKGRVQSVCKQSLSFIQFGI